MQAPEIVAAVRSVIGDKPVKLHAPDVGGLEKQYTLAALDAGELSYGAFVQTFESTLAGVVGRKYAVALSSGTAALHLAMVALGWGRVPGNVFMPSLTFVATANAANYCGVKPWFCEDGKYSVASHLLGRLERDFTDWNMPFPSVEDAAPALGTTGAGKQAHVACFSFNGNKIVTAGGGGAVVTDDESLAHQIRHLANQAKSSATEHDQVGFNYRMPNLNAALGLAQLERLNEFLERKQRLADRYAQVFGELFWKPPEGSNNWLNAILVDNRDEVVSALNDAGFESRPLHAPLHTLPMYRDCPRTDMTRTMDIWNRCVCLPSGAGLA